MAEQIDPRKYPRWKYHPIEQAVIVNTPEEERELTPESEWFNSPADFTVPKDKSRAAEMAEIVNKKAKK